MLIKIIFAGFGGQGIISMGHNVAQAALTEGKNVTHLPSYGAEMRGGTANCTVAVSDEEIASPVASSPEFVVVMNQPSLIKFQNQIESGGVIFVNSSLIDYEITRGDVEVIKVPATKIAEELGSTRSANMVMLGAFIRRTNLITIDTMINVVKTAMGNKSNLFTVNKKALLTGYDLFR